MYQYYERGSVSYVGEGESEKDPTTLFEAFGVDISMFYETDNNANAGTDSAEKQPLRDMTADDLTAGVADILTVLIKAGLCASRSEARRNVEQGGVTVNGEKVTDARKAYTADMLKNGILVKRGKKNFMKVVYNG